LETNKINAAVEAILFAAGEPVEAEKIALALDLTKQNVFDAIKNTSDKYANNNSGLCILNLDGKFQMSIKLEYTADVRKVLDIKRNTPLSPAAFEVLAVVAYNQPTTKAFVDRVRGVDCGGVINSLCQKGLIEEKGRLDLPGKPLVYGTTADFLRCFSLGSLCELPPVCEPDNDETKNDDLIQEQI
jgi:segregation and condensation protein B